MTDQGEHDEVRLAEVEYESLIEKRDELDNALHAENEKCDKKNDEIMAEVRRNDEKLHELDLQCEKLEKRMRAVADQRAETHEKLQALKAQQPVEDPEKTLIRNVVTTHLSEISRCLENIKDAGDLAPLPSMAQICVSDVFKEARKRTGRRIELRQYAKAAYDWVSPEDIEKDGFVTQLAAVITKCTEFLVVLPNVPLEVEVEKEDVSDSGISSEDASSETESELASIIESTSPDKDLTSEASSSASPTSEEETPASEADQQSSSPMAVASVTKVVVSQGKKRAAPDDEKRTSKKRSSAFGKAVLGFSSSHEEGLEFDILGDP